LSNLSDQHSKQNTHKSQAESTSGQALEIEKGDQVNEIEDMQVGTFQSKDAPLESILTGTF
jgi:hypothetical protein